PPPYSRQQRAEWELCMCHIAMSRPARRQDAHEMCQLIGVKGEIGNAPEEQLRAIGDHMAGLEPWLTPRAFEASVERLCVVGLAIAEAE
ncbi:MAG TPA: hypothetical protein VGR90_10180, partial [Acidimicrobiales bacterium]|nr:hypothetical protein [Acidimicrobiales bacterium]